MVDYVSLAATAKRLIDANGRDITLTKRDRTPADSAKPWRGGNATPTSVGPVKGVLVPFESEEVDGSLVRRDDKKALIAANDDDSELLEQFDVLIDGDATDPWRILTVEVINPGDTRVIYKMQVRK